MRIIIKFTLIFIFMAIGAAFAVNNASPVDLNYFLGVTKAPLALVVIVMLVAGAILGVFVCLGRIVRLRHEISELSRKLQLSQKEIENLRALPIKD